MVVLMGSAQLCVIPVNWGAEPLIVTRYFDFLFLFSFFFFWSIIGNGNCVYSTDRKGFKRIYYGDGADDCKLLVHFFVFFSSFYRLSLSLSIYIYIFWKHHFSVMYLGNIPSISMIARLPFDFIRLNIISYHIIDY